MRYYTLLLPPPHPVSPLAKHPPVAQCSQPSAQPQLCWSQFGRAQCPCSILLATDVHERTCGLCLGNAWKIWLQYRVALCYLLYCLKNIWPLLERARRDALQLAPEIARAGLHNFAAKKHPFSSAACPCPWSSSGEEKPGLQSLRLGMNHRRKVS